MAEHDDNIRVTTDVTIPLWLRIILRDGPITLIALTLLAALLGWIPSPIETMLIILQRQTEILASHNQEMTKEHYDDVSNRNYQNMLLRAICRGIVPAANQYQCEPKYQGYEEK